MRVRTTPLLVACLAIPAIATAQPSPPVPAPPHAPAEPLPGPTVDPVLAEQVAATLVARAQELYAARQYADAKQLAVEASVKSPRGAAAAQARFLITQINQQLGITEAPASTSPAPDDKVDLSPIADPVTAPPAVEVAPEGRRSRRGRTILSGAVWGGVIGGLFADAVDVDGTTGGHVALGIALGAGVGGAGGLLFARERAYTPGDIALMDTFAGIGAVGGLTVGMLMQPAEGEAYAVNAILGTAGGLVVGYLAAPETNTTERRMLRVAGLAAAGGALPFLLYAGIRDEGSSADERVVGALSTVGLLAGAYVGFRLTRDLDVGQDVLPGARAPRDDAPVALIGRHSDGRWTPGGVALQPLSRQLAPQPGLALPVLGARF